MRTYVFDIDGTICQSNSQNDYVDSVPMPERIQIVNRLFDAGNTIIFHTARGMGRYKNDQVKAESQFYDLTVSQLRSWGVKHHFLMFGKPAGDFYVDDKAVNDFSFFQISKEKQS